MRDEEFSGERWFEVAVFVVALAVIVFCVAALSGCSRAIPADYPAARERPEVFAEVLYEAGLDPSPNPASRLAAGVAQAFRAVCLREQARRGLVIDTMRSRRRTMFLEWWRDHPAEEATVVYVPDDEEELAMQQRDACGEAW